MLREVFSAMKIITDEKELAGKTIKKAALSDNGHLFGIVFTDDTYCVIDPIHNTGPERPEMELLTGSEVDNYCLDGLDLLLGLQGVTALAEKNHATDVCDIEEAQAIISIFMDGVARMGGEFPTDQSCVTVLGSSCAYWPEDERDKEKNRVAGKAADLICKMYELRALEDE
jgi:hypothetical protein